MSKSLEALDNIVVTFDEMGFAPTTSNPNSDFSFLYWFGGEYNTIKQDLERLEQLEKAIQILKSNLYIVFNDSYNGVSFKKDKYDECDYTVLCLNLKSQYDLLKEVLKNDK